MNWDDKNSVNYLKFFINKNFFSFFEKDKRDSLEKLFLYDVNDNLGKINSNLNLGIAAVLNPKSLMSGHSHCSSTISLKTTTTFNNSMVGRLFEAISPLHEKGFFLNYFLLYVFLNLLIIIKAYFINIYF